MLMIVLSSQFIEFLGEFEGKFCQKEGVPTDIKFSDGTHLVVTGQIPELKKAGYYMEKAVLDTIHYPLPTVLLRFSGFIEWIKYKECLFESKQYLVYRQAVRIVNMFAQLIEDDYDNKYPREIRKQVEVFKGLGDHRNAYWWEKNSDYQLQTVVVSKRNRKKLIVLKRNEAVMSKKKPKPKPC